VRCAEEELIDILRKTGLDFAASLPCEKIKNLLVMVGRSFFHVPLTREEEGVGICAGAALAGKRPAMFIQSSGIGNMLNALLSLTGFYRLPLALFVSQRGIYKEKIEAQLPMGKVLPDILRGAALPHSIISTREDFSYIARTLPEVYRGNHIHAFLLSPAIWEEDSGTLRVSHRAIKAPKKKVGEAKGPLRPLFPRHTRYEILEIIAPWLEGKVVVCNLGFPSKELFRIMHQPSNFYMLGSMGMATPIGLGIALSKDKEVVVIDGDGSLLMNPGTLATAAHFAPGNLTIFAVDNATYGSTGSQPTLTGSCVDLERVARGFGIQNTVKISGKKQIMDVMKKSSNELTFIHALALPGNLDVPNISIHHLENKRLVMEFLKS
jgi:sulfopyruvate decarboxylase subunit beta